MAMVWVAYQNPLVFRCICFDLVNSARITRRLNIPDSDLMIDMHYDIYFWLTDYDLDELRKYDSAREFVEATNFMQSDSIYNECVGSERDYKGSDIVAIAKERAEEYAANGYERTVDTVYANCIGINENSKWLNDFMEKYDEDVFSFCVKEGDTYWFALARHNSQKDMLYWCLSEVRSCIDNYFPDIQESEYEVRDTVAFDEWEYYIYFDFTVKDVCDAWLAEMDNWEGHWNYFLYGYYDEEEDAEWPGYYQNNWFSPGTTYGKTTLHYPDQYDYYVKDPGVYTVTATIDGCNGVITDQFVVKEGPHKPAGSKTRMAGNILKKTVNRLRTSGLKNSSIGITSKTMVTGQSAYRRSIMPGTILTLTE